MYDGKSQIYKTKSVAKSQIIKTKTMENLQWKITNK